MFPVADEKRMAAVTKCLDDNFKSDSYVTRFALYAQMKANYKDLPFDVLNYTVDHMEHEGKLVIEDDRIYTEKNYRYEKELASLLQELSQRNEVPYVDVPDNVVLGNFALSKEQRDAVAMALNNKVSIISGGAGTGKTSIIRAICILSKLVIDQIVLAAPTGKAARNLEERTHFTSRTVHSALGLCPGADFLKQVIWSRIRLVVIDEASMIDQGMMAGILKQVMGVPECRLVLLGDTKQLPPVGPGETLGFLHRIGVPEKELTENHRQNKAANSLVANIVHFDEIRNTDDFVYDERFQINEVSDDEAAKAIAAEAAVRYRKRESIQVLSPRCSGNALSTRHLNAAIQAQVNPMYAGKLVVRQPDGQEFRDGDRVMFTENNADLRVVNGDVGVLRLKDISCEPRPYLDDHYDFSMRVTVDLPDGRHPSWELLANQAIRNLELAYCISIHKSQGSEYDTVLIAMSNSMGMMRYRNLLYTGISRGREKVVIYGSKQAVNVALCSEPPARNCTLEERYNKLHKARHSKAKKEPAAS